MDFFFANPIIADESSLFSETLFIHLVSGWWSMVVLPSHVKSLVVVVNRAMIILSPGVIRRNQMKLKVKVKTLYDHSIATIGCSSQRRNSPGIKMESPLDQKFVIIFLFGLCSDRERKSRLLYILIYIYIDE